MARQLGDILVDTGIITSKTLERALERQQGSGLRLGQVLETMGVITETELLKALQHQSGPFGDQERKKQLGKILVQTGLITDKTLERALARQRKSGKRLGELLEEMGVITEQELLDALGQQCGFKMVQGIANRSYPPELLNLLPVELIMKRAVFPLKQSRTRLAVAVDDPLDGRVIELISRITGLEVVPVIASRGDILAAVARHYLHQPIRQEAADTILVATHSASVASGLQAVLHAGAYLVLFAKDGIEALQLAKAYRPQLVVAELHLPQFDAYRLLHELRHCPTTAETPVMLLTDKVAGEEGLQLLEDGFFDYILKPVQPEQVLTRVKRALKHS